MKRKIIHIDDELCNGCGECIPNCPEGAIQMIDGKARLVSELSCDGLGACLGTCPQGAITIEEREAEPYDERKVIEQIIPQGDATLKAHLKHLRDHREINYMRQAMEVLRERNIPVPDLGTPSGGGCPGMQAVSMKRESSLKAPSEVAPSQLQHWPVQLHLISPVAEAFQKADVLLAADCSAFTCGGFHNELLANHTLAIACPKLDQGLDIYKEKIRAMIDEAKINTLTVLMMEVPCCGGLLKLAQDAAGEAQRKIPIKKMIMSIQGEIIQEDWVKKQKQQRKGNEHEYVLLSMSRNRKKYRLHHAGCLRKTARNCKPAGCTVVCMQRHRTPQRTGKRAQRDDNG